MIFHYKKTGAFYAPFFIPIFFKAVFQIGKTSVEIFNTMVPEM